MEKKERKILFVRDEFSNSFVTFNNYRIFFLLTVSFLLDSPVLRLRALWEREQFARDTHHVSKLLRKLESRPKVSRRNGEQKDSRIQQLRIPFRDAGSEQLLHGTASLHRGCGREIFLLTLLTCKI